MGILDSLGLKKKAEDPDLKTVSLIEGDDNQRYEFSCKFKLMENAVWYKIINNKRTPHKGNAYSLYVTKSDKFVLRTEFYIPKEYVDIVKKLPSSGSMSYSTDLKGYVIDSSIAFFNNSEELLEHFFFDCRKEGVTLASAKNIPTGYKKLLAKLDDTLYERLEKKILGKLNKKGEEKEA